jgi:hypothetical protein
MGRCLWCGLEPGHLGATRTFLIATGRARCRIAPRGRVRQPGDRAVERGQPRGADHVILEAAQERPRLVKHVRSAPLAIMDRAAERPGGSGRVLMRGGRREDSSRPVAAPGP